MLLPLNAFPPELRNSSNVKDFHWDGLKMWATPSIKEPNAEVAHTEKLLGSRVNEFDPDRITPKKTGFFSGPDLEGRVCAYKSRDVKL